MCVVQIRTWIPTLVTCLTMKEKREGHRQKLFEDSYDFILTLAINEFIGNVRGFVVSVSIELLKSYKSQDHRSVGK